MFLLNVHEYSTSHPPLLKEPQTVTINFPSKPFTLSSTISFSWIISARGIRCSNSWKYLRIHVSGRLLHMRHMRHSQSKLVYSGMAIITNHIRTWTGHFSYRSLNVTSSYQISTHKTDSHRLEVCSITMSHGSPHLTHTERKYNGRAYVCLATIHWWLLVLQVRGAHLYWSDRSESISESFICKDLAINCYKWQNGQQF